MTLRFLEAARRELDEAFAWYESQSPGLGDDFIAEANQTLQRIQEAPDLYRPFADQMRRALLKRFPYGVIFGIDEANDLILILAVAHLHRKPYYWRGRIQEPPTAPYRS